MILVDSSIWVDHLREANLPLVHELEEGNVLCHPYVIGELAMGSLKDRAQILRNLSRLPVAVVARDGEVLRMIEADQLFSLGLGYIDAHLLTATRLTAGAKLWTRDRRLHDAALRLGLAARAH